MDEKSFLDLIQDKIALLMKEIADKRPIAEISTMILDRRMDEREFLELLQHKVEQVKNVVVQPTLQEFSSLITHQC